MTCKLRDPLDIRHEDFPFSDVYEHLDGESPAGHDAAERTEQLSAVLVRSLEYIAGEPATLNAVASGRRAIALRKLLEETGNAN